MRRGASIAIREIRWRDPYSLSGPTLSAPYTVTSAAGPFSTSFTIRATDDSAPENVGGTVTLSTRDRPFTNASLGSRTVTIPPSAVENVPEVTHGARSSVTEAGAALFTLDRIGAATAALTVSITVTAIGSTPHRQRTSVTFRADRATAALSPPTHDETVIRNAGWHST